MTVGERIRTARKNASLTQKQLGEKCGINEANIRKYESGRQNPKRETLQKMADALEIPVVFFYSEEEQKHAILLSIASDIEKEDGIQSSDENLFLKAAKVMAEMDSKELSEWLMDFIDASVNLSDIESELLSEFSYLNETGQKTAVERVKELTKIPEYQKK